MRIFISWSGNRSKKVAEFLSAWLKKLPLTITLWVSGKAIDPGTRWNKELNEALENTSFGILCITPENQGEPWICFEAGALAKFIDKSYVIPFLIDMNISGLENLWKQFQSIEANKDGTWNLIETIYKASEDQTRSINDLVDPFEMFWPKLEEIIEVAKREIDGELIIEKEPTLSDVKSDLEKLISLSESLSSRLTKLETKNLLEWEKFLLPAMSKSSPSNIISKIDKFNDYYNKIKMTELIKRLEKITKQSISEKEIKKLADELEPSED